MVRKFLSSMPWWLWLIIGMLSAGVLVIIIFIIWYLRMLSWENW